MTNYNEWLNEKKRQNCCESCIDLEDINRFIISLKGLFFPGFVDSFDCIEDYLDLKDKEIRTYLDKLLISIEKITNKSFNKDEIKNKFLESFPKIDYLINTDIKAIYDGDPAAKSSAEIVLCYPGFKAIFIYRIAHVLYELNVPLLPRILTEYAHSETGIDINPGAKIDEYFFIDHGTGIVIGETCIIGKHVRLYQGVTLGALSLSKGHDLVDVKRHPTIEDNVTIYSGASIFGGETVIGHNTTIGSSVFITKSVEPNMVVTIQGISAKKHLNGGI